MSAVADVAKAIKTADVKVRCMVFPFCVSKMQSTAVDHQGLAPAWAFLWGQFAPPRDLESIRCSVVFHGHTRGKLAKDRPVLEQMARTATC